MRTVIAVWSLALVTACDGLGATAPEPSIDASSVPVVPAIPDDPLERAERIADVQHMLQDVLAATAEGDRGRARLGWDAAWSAFQAMILPTLRDQDPDAAIRAEYRFGRLRDAIERRRRADDAIRFLDGVLESQRRAALGVDGR